MIQCAEQLEAPQACCATHTTPPGKTDLDAATHGACRAGALTDLGLKLGLDGYPPRGHGNGTVQKCALQYVENHDHARFVNHFGVIAERQPV